MKNISDFRDGIFQIDTDTDRMYAKSEYIDINRKTEEVLYITNISTT